MHISASIEPRTNLPGFVWATCLPRTPWVEKTAVLTCPLVHRNPFHCSGTAARKFCTCPPASTRACELRPRTRRGRTRTRQRAPRTSLLCGLFDIHDSMLRVIFMKSYLSSYPVYLTFQISQCCLDFSEN